jgi:hypothetical protein
LNAFKKVSEDKDDSFQLVEAASELFGSLAGVATTVVHNDIAGLFAGAIVASGVTQTLKYAARLSLSRLMAKRERQRVGFVYGSTALAIQERLDKGEQPRTDGFFDRDTTDRSKADEIAEAVLNAAQREHEEKKLPYLANLLAFIAFESRIDVGTANHIVRIARSLSYRQFCVLALAPNAAKLGLHSAPFPNAANATSTWTLLIEIFELFRLQLITYGQGFFTDVTEMPLERLQIDTLGAQLYLAMKLDEIPSADIEAITALLR